MTAPHPFDRLSPRELERILAAALSEGARFAEIFIERTAERSLRREEGTLRSVNVSLEAGAGIRAIGGDGTGYAYTSNPGLDSLLLTARAAGRIARANPGTGRMSSGTDLGEGGGSVSIAVREGWEPSPDEIAGRAAFLEEIDILARRADPRVADVTAGVSEESRSIFVMNSSGAKASEEQTLCGLSATAYVKDGGKSQRGSFGGGGRESFESLAGGRLSSGTLAREAVRRAVVLLDAIEAPAGEWPVVIGNGWGGVLLHEAIGHGFEADFVRRGSSNYTGRVGQRVASEICTVIDDGSIRGLRGSYGVDDEGTPSRRTTLVRNGILVGYLHDLLSADALGQAPSGNGRRQSFRTPPLPRQSNIFLEAGSEDPEEILRSVHRGLFARSLGGGQVDIVNGNFVFQVTEGYLIEEGRITAPVIGASLIGTGHDILSKVARVGADFSFDPGVGTCGKDGQRQPVGVGQPTLLVSAMTVGGTRL